MDLSKYSDAELEAIANQKSDLSKFSDEELERIAGKEHKSSLGRSVAMGAKDIVAGIPGFADLLLTPIREGANLVLPDKYKMRPMQQAISEGIDNLTGGWTKPRTNAEKVQSTVQQEIAGLPFGGVLGKGAKLVGKGGKAIGNFLTQAGKISVPNVLGTAATAGAVQQSLNTNPNSPVSALLAGLVGGGVGSAVGNAKNAVSRIVNPAKMTAFKEAGIQPLLADVSNSKLLKGAQHHLEWIPGSGHTIRTAKGKQYESMKNTLGQGNYEDVLTHAQAQEKALAGARSHQGKQGKIHAEGFGRFNQDVSKLPDKSIDLTNTARFFDKETKNLQNAPMWAEFKKTPLGKELHTIFQNGTTQDYHQVRQTLDRIQDKVTTWGSIGTKSKSSMEKLWGTLAEDIKSSLTPKLEKLHPEAAKNWQDIKGHYHDYAKGEIPHLNELYKAGKKNTVDAFSTLKNDLKHGAKKAELALEGASPKDRIELSTALNKELGSTGDGSFSLAKWHTGFKGLQPEARQVLLSPLPEQSKRKITALAEAMGHVKETLNEANTSKSGHYNTMANLGVTALASLGSATSGNLLPFAKLAMGLVATRIGAEALTNPKVINFLYEAAKSRNYHQFMAKLSNAHQYKLSKNEIIAINDVYKDFEAR